MSGRRLKPHRRSGILDEAAQEVQRFDPIRDAYVAPGLSSLGIDDVGDMEFLLPELAEPFTHRLLDRRVVRGVELDCSQNTKIGNQSLSLIAVEWGERLRASGYFTALRQGSQILRA